MILQAAVWHPMLPDVIGKTITSRFMVLQPYEDGYRCLTKEGVFPVLHNRIYDAMMNHKENSALLAVNRASKKGLSVAFDFLKKEVFLVQDPSVLLNGLMNDDLPMPITPSNIVSDDVGVGLAEAWLDNVYQCSSASIRDNLSDRSEGVVIDMIKWRDSRKAAG